MLTQIISGDIMSAKLEDIIMRTGESNRIIIFRLVDGKGDAITAEDYTMEFILQKPDGNFIIQTLGTITDGFYLHTIEQMAAVKGMGYYTLRISDTDDLIYTAHGAVIIDDNTLSDGDIESISLVNGLRFPDDFLTINDNVAVIDDDTTSTDSTWSSDKISDELENISIDVSKTATGNPVEFTDGASSPLIECVTQITGYQSGTGTPSPDNVRPIVAYTEGEIEVSDGDGNTTTHTATFSNSIYQGNADFVGGRVMSDYIFGDFANVDWTPSTPEKHIFRGVLTSVVNASIELSALTSLCNKYGAMAWADISASDNGKYSYAVPANRIVIIDHRFSTVSDFVSSLSDIQMVFKLVAPTTTSITPTNLPIKSLFGYNHIESSTGDLDITYITEGYQPIVDLIEDASGVTYSETEHKIGKWIDGSTLYAKTYDIDISNPPATYSTQIDVTGLNIVKIEKHFAEYLYNSVWYYLVGDSLTYNNSEYLHLQYYGEQKNIIELYAHLGNVTEIRLCFTLFYTK